MGLARPASARRAVGLASGLLIACWVGSGCSGPGENAPPASPVQATASGRSAPTAVESSATASYADRSDTQRGYASWYGAALAGHRMANGDRFDPNKLTAAHRSLPFGTWVEVRRVDSGAAVRVQITDRGPFGHADRIIDLARAAADKIGMRKSGVALVDVRVVGGP